MYQNLLYRNGQLDLSAAGFYTPWDPSTAAPGEENPQRVMGHDPYGVDRAPSLGAGKVPVPKAKPGRKAKAAAPAAPEAPLTVSNPFYDAPQEGEAYGPMRAYDGQAPAEMPPLENGGRVDPLPGQQGDQGPSEADMRAAMGIGGSQGPRQLLPEDMPPVAPQAGYSVSEEPPVGQPPMMAQGRQEAPQAAPEKKAEDSTGGLWGEGLRDLALNVGIGLLSSSNPQEGIAAGLQQWQGIMQQKRKEKLQKEQFEREMLLRERSQGSDEKFRGRQLDQQDSHFGQQIGLEREQQADHRNEFGQEIGLKGAALAQDDRHFGAEMGLKGAALAQDDRHFGSQMGMQERELAQRGDLARAGMAQDDRHFAADMGYKRDAMAQDDSHFGSQLGWDQRKTAASLGMQERELAQRGDLARAGMAQDDRHFAVTSGFQDRELGLKATEHANMDRYRALTLAQDAAKMASGERSGDLDRASREKIAEMNAQGDGWSSQVLPSEDGQGAVMLRTNKRTGEVQQAPLSGVAAGLSMVSPGVKADQEVESSLYTNARVAKDRVDQLQATQQLLEQNPGTWGPDIQSRVWRGATSFLGLDPASNLQQVQQLGASGELDQAIAKMSKQGQITENERLLLKKSLVDPTSLNPEAARILLPKLIQRSQEDIDKADAYTRTPRDQRGSAREWEFRWDQDRRATKGGPMSGNAPSGTTSSGVKWQLVN